jgi:hypothetical protein
MDAIEDTTSIPVGESTPVAGRWQRYSGTRGQARSLIARRRTWFVRIGQVVLFGTAFAISQPGDGKIQSHA